MVLLHVAYVGVLETPLVCLSSRLSANIDADRVLGTIVCSAR